MTQDYDVKIMEKVKQIDELFTNLNEMNNLLSFEHKSNLEIKSTSETNTN